MNARVPKKRLKIRALRAAALAIGLLAGSSGTSAAYVAQAKWKPVSGAAGYKIYVGYDADLVGWPWDVGKPPLQNDGNFRMNLSLNLASTTHVTITAYNANGEGDVSNMLTLTYAQVASVIDSDGDGLTDAEEDKNLNRRRDAGETSTQSWDTDGDGISDGQEALAGTNPLDPGSVAYCTGACASAIWIEAAQSVARYNGAMTADGRYASSDLDPARNAIGSLQVFANNTSNAMLGGSGDWAQYNVTLPAAGTWYLWARMYYPGAAGSNNANSFFVRVDTAAPLRKLGNNKDKFRVWHWDGNGDVETGGPLPLNLGILTAGTHRLYIEKREVYPTQPRVDVLVLTRSTTYVPSDADAVAALGVDNALTVSAAEFADDSVPPEDATTTTTLKAACTDHDDCDDLISCTVDRCDLESGECIYYPFDALCDDGDACNGAEVCDVYDDCQFGNPLICDDGLVCDGVESCDPAAGCVAGVVPTCDDGVACTIDQCVESFGGCHNFTHDGACEDGNGCTDDRCTPSGCAYDQNTSPCDDGLWCTAQDQCAAGVCAGRDQCAGGFHCDAELDACKAEPGDPDDDGLVADADPCPVDARNLCAGPVAVDGDSNDPIRINAYNGDANCGGVKVDCNGDTWMADFGYTGPGRRLSCDVGGWTDTCEIARVEKIFGCTSEATQDLLRCARGGQSHGGDVTYRFAVPDGRYVVNLLFAGIEDRQDDDRRDVLIEGRQVADGLDPVNAANGLGRALLRAYVVEVRDGNGIEISLHATGDASLNALEILTLTQ